MGGEPGRSRELATVVIEPAPASSITRERYAQLAQQAKLLSWLSLAWMTVEGAVAIGAGIVASSITLVGFRLGNEDGFQPVHEVGRLGREGDDVAGGLHRPTLSNVCSPLLAMDHRVGIGPLSRSNRNSSTAS